MTTEPPAGDQPPFAPPTDPYAVPPGGTAPAPGAAPPPPPYGAPPYGAPPTPAYGYPPASGAASGAPLASPWRRLGGALLSLLLMIATLVIGYLVWAIIEWQHSRTPAKRLLNMTVVSTQTGQPATFGEMVMRQVVWYLVLWIGSSLCFILGLVDAFMVFSDNRQRLLDRMASTVVVHTG
jgi:uncharacterized RDD family membrane protein YckC